MCVLLSKRKFISIYINYLFVCCIKTMASYSVHYKTSNLSTDVQKIDTIKTITFVANCKKQKVIVSCNVTRS